MGRYGLWEYTSDNTGMGDQIKQLMSNDKAYEIGGESPSHSLENEGHKMNDQINKFAEASYSPPSNIDPLEQPPGMDRMVAEPNQPKEVEVGAMDTQKLSNSEDVSVVTIPSSLTIEDEHGRHLDTASNIITQEPVKSESKVQQAIKSEEIANNNHHLKTTDFLVEKLSNTTTAFEDVSSKKSSEKQSFTVRLLKAMKEDAGFRRKAESFLPQQTDTGLQLFQKDRQLFNLLKKFESEPKKKFDDLSISKLHIPQLKKNKEGKLLSAIRLLIHDDYSSHGEEQKVVNDLLNTMNGAEREEGKIESDFSDTGAAGGGESLSDGYLNHFKEFMANHKKQTLNHENNADQHHEASEAIADVSSQPGLSTHRFSTLKSHTVCLCVCVSNRFSEHNLVISTPFNSRHCQSETGN